MSNEIEIPLKISGVTSLKAELRQLKVAIAEASDPEQMSALAQKAGEVADRIKDANEQVAVFTSGSKFESVNNSFSSIGDKLRSLDFEGASEKAAVFSKTLGSLKMADVSKGLLGLTKTVGIMSKAFLKFGIQLLLNPIFLLVVVVAAIVVAIGLFLNKIGVLEKVLYFAFLPLNLLIQGFQELTDWLGLTQHAAEENAKSLEKSNEKAFKSSEKRAEKVGDSYDIEIAKAKAAGKDTKKLEMEKSKATSDSANDRLSKARKEFAELKGLTSKDATERRKKLRERIEAENKLIKDGSKERILMKIQEGADEAAADKKIDDDAKAKREERLKKYKEGAAAIQNEINTANKLVVDSGKTQQQKEVDDVKTKYAALILEAEKYKKDITALEKARTVEITAINKAASEAEALKVKEKNDIKFAAENAQYVKLQELILKDAEFKKLQLQLQFDKDIEVAGGNAELEKALTKKLQLDLNAIDKEGRDTALAQEKQYLSEVQAANDALAAAKFGAVKGTLDAIGALAGQNKKVADALFIVDKALAIGQIIVNTQKEISAYASNPTWSLLPDGGASLKIPAIAGAKIRAATSIGTIAASSIGKFMNGSGGIPSTPQVQSIGGSGGGSDAQSVSSFVPGNLFGQGNNANNVGQGDGVETNQTITVNAVVSETEMTGVQNKVNKILKNAVL